MSSDDASFPSHWLMWLRACHGAVELVVQLQGAEPVLVLLSSCGAKGDKTKSEFTILLGHGSSQGMIQSLA